MKKVLTIIGLFISFIFVTATLFKLMHWPGGGPLFVVSMTLFSFIFLPLFFIQRMIENRSGLSITTNIFALISTWMMFTGVMFKVMHWPGAGPLMVFGVLIFICPTLILYTIQQFKAQRKFSEYWRFLTASILCSVLLMIFGLAPSQNVLTAFIYNEDAILRSNASLKKQNDRNLMMITASADASSAKALTDIHNQSEEMNIYIEEVKTELISMVEADPEALNDHWRIGQIDNYDMPTHFLGSGYSQKGKELEEKLNLYKLNLSNAMNTLPFADKQQIIKEAGDFGIETSLRNDYFENQFET
jgi:hypothetical protein